MQGPRAKTMPRAPRSVNPALILQVETKKRNVQLKQRKVIRHWYVIRVMLLVSALNSEYSPGISCYYLIFQGGARIQYS